MNDQNFEEVIPNVLVAHCPLSIEGIGDVAVVLAKGERLTVIDTGVRAYMPQAIEPALGALDQKLSDVALIVNTHGDWDHVEGNDVIRQASGAQVWIPEADAKELETPPDRLLHDGDAIELGNGLHFQVVATPGHSKGMACMYEPGAKLLIVSDAAQGYGPGHELPLYFSSGRRFRSGIEKLLGLDVETLVVGHPFKWSGKSQIIHRGRETVRRYLTESLEASRWVERAVGQAIGQCAVQTLDCIFEKTIAVLRDDPTYPFRLPTQTPFRYSIGSVRCELKDIGLRPVKAE